MIPAGNDTGQPDEVIDIEIQGLGLYDEKDMYSYMRRIFGLLMIMQFA